MKKNIFTLFAIALFATATAQTTIEDAGFLSPWPDQKANWSVNATNELIFSGAITAPAPASCIASIFDGLLSDGNGNNDFSGITLKFDGYIFDQNTATQVLIGWDKNWGGKTLLLDYSQWKPGATHSWDWANFKNMIVLANAPAYQAAINKNNYNTFEIKISATGLVETKINNYVCDEPFQADMTILKPTDIKQFYVAWACSYPGYRMKNVSITKGATTQKYLESATAVTSIKNNNINTFPNPCKNSISVTGVEAGQEFSITNFVGQVVMKGIIKTNRQDIDMSAFKAGQYMLTVNSAEGKLVKAIIKQ
jgi:hypothetical protein